MAEEEKSDEEVASDTKGVADSVSPTVAVFGGSTAGASAQSIGTEFSEVVYEDRECLDDGDADRSRLLNCVVEQVWPSEGFDSSDTVVRTWCKLIVSSAERESDAFNTRGRAVTPTLRDSSHASSSFYSSPTVGESSQRRKSSILRREVTVLQLIDWFICCSQDGDVYSETSKSTLEHMSVVRLKLIVLAVRSCVHTHV